MLSYRENHLMVSYETGNTFEDVNSIANLLISLHSSAAFT